jgi:NAD+ synthase (glutamine-hydrolysing)
MRVALAQLNPVVGDLAGNVGRVRDTLAQVAPQNPDLVVFSELFLLGYPPRDLVSRNWFVKRSERALSAVVELSRKYPDLGVVVGSVVRSGLDTGKGLYNAAVLISGGKELLRQPKSLLPNYDVFDETRYFDSAPVVTTVPFRGEVLGLSVCEDAWNVPEMVGRRVYASDPIASLAQAGATLFVNVAASPYTMGKEELRFRLLSSHCRRHKVPLVSVNQVGANDDLVFDGRSMAIDSSGLALAALPSFQESVTMVDTRLTGSKDGYVPQNRIQSVRDALVLGVRDYVRKCGFERAVIGLSGGIDSAVTCCLAVEALGRENVLGVTMPSEYSSAGSVEDSRRLAQNLGIEFRVIPITPMYRGFLDALREQFAGKAPDVTEENLQARVRSSILMALSNKFGYILLSTGNKSELAVGYCTLYGDMSGGLCVLADVPKTMVYELARLLSRQTELIPQTSISKPPSAELRANQVDADTLPPYEILDQIIDRYVEDGRSATEIIAAGFKPEVVNWVVNAVNRNEYKRRQAAPGIKVTSKAFGTGWRMPIAARYPSDD